MNFRYRVTLIISTLVSYIAFGVNGAQRFTPVANNAGTLALHSSSFGESAKLGLGVNYNLAVDPAEFGDSKGKMSNYVHSLNFDMGAKIGSRVHAFLDMPLLYISPIASDLNNALASTGNNKFVVGNLKLGVGFSLMDNSEGGLGIGIIPHLVAPVGKLFGNKNFYVDGPRSQKNAFNERNFKNDLQYGATLALDYKLEHLDLAIINVGWDHEADIDVITWGFGYQKSFLNENHFLIFEFRGEVNTERLAKESDPLEVDLAYRGFCHHKSAVYTFGAGRGLGNNYGSPDLRVFVGANWQIRD